MDIDWTGNMFDANFLEALETIFPEQKVEKCLCGSQAIYVGANSASSSAVECARCGLKIRVNHSAFHFKRKKFKSTEAWFEAEKKWYDEEAKRRWNFLIANS